ncbi:MAG: MFS transporter [Candidatus Sulfotelmatobacter sp.]
MRSILGQRSLRFVFAANVISMLGSGMNSAAVAWYVLKATHSEMALGMFAVLQTIPAILMLPFTGVIIDREDRRRLVMWLDAVRAVIIVTVAILAFRHRVQVWQLYLMTRWSRPASGCSGPPLPRSFRNSPPRASSCNRILSCSPACKADG